MFNDECRCPMCLEEEELRNKVTHIRCMKCGKLFLIDLLKNSLCMICESIKKVEDKKTKVKDRFKLIFNNK